MKEILEFLEYNKDKCIGIMSIDVEGGFNTVNIDKLYDILKSGECEPNVVVWIRRWIIGRRIHLRFNRRVNKEYNLHKGVRESLLVLLCFFGVYITDMFNMRFGTKINLM